MNGSFGVFCDVGLIGGSFGNDDDADEHMRDLVKCGEYDAHELVVRPICDDYELWWRLLDGLRASRRHDLALERLQRLRKEAGDAAA